MHQWSTSTYKSYCTIVEEVDLLQVAVPQLGLRYGFLMDGLFALAALELATSPITTSNGHSKSAYVRAAMEYYDRALSAFRVELVDITLENHLALYMFSYLAGTFALVIPRVAPQSVSETIIGQSQSMSTLDSIKTMMKMMQGTGALIIKAWNWLREGPLQIDKALAQEAPYDKLDEGTKAAMARLHAINDARNKNDNGDKSNDDNNDADKTGDQEDRPPPAWTACKQAILFLEENFAKELEGSIKSICMSWLVRPWKEFHVLLEQSDPLALLILMHWSVMLHRLDGEFFWANKAGRNLTMDILAILNRTPAATPPEWRECMFWACEQVGLSALVQIVETQRSALNE